MQTISIQPGWSPQFEYADSLFRTARIPAARPQGRRPGAVRQPLPIVSGGRVLPAPSNTAAQSAKSTGSVWIPLEKQAGRETVVFGLLLAAAIAGIGSAASCVLAPMHHGAMLVSQLP